MVVTQPQLGDWPMRHAISTAHPRAASSWIKSMKASVILSLSEAVKLGSKLNDELLQLLLLSKPSTKMGFHLGEYCIKNFNQHIRKTVMFVVLAVA